MSFAGWALAAMAVGTGYSIYAGERGAKAAASGVKKQRNNTARRNKSQRIRGSHSRLRKNNCGLGSVETKLG